MIPHYRRIRVPLPVLLLALVAALFTMVAKADDLPLDPCPGVPSTQSSSPAESGPDVRPRKDCREATTTVS